MRAAIRKVISLDFGGQPDERSPAPDTHTDGASDLEGMALLITSDSLSQQWAPRWLQHSGLSVRITDTPEEALRIATEEQPSLIIADAAITTQDRHPLLQKLGEIHGKDVPLIALCANAGDVTTAADANVTDIVRRPYDWQVITRRAVKAVRAYRNLADLREARESLENLQHDARTARRDQARQAGIDKLTRLPNLERFRSLLHRTITTHESSKGDVGLLVIGIDHYRVVNDAVGHENANRLLRHFADRLRSCLRDRDVIGNADSGIVTAVAARLGGARFALLISNAGSDEIYQVSQAIVSALEQPFEVAGQSIYLTASIGGSVYPPDCTSADGLLQCADAAMRDARDSGVGFSLFTSPVADDSSRQLHLDRMLREAVRNGDLRLAYQPITDSHSGKVVCAEALLRWQHAEEGAISPADFVPVAEKTGLMREIGDFVIRTACAQLRDWMDAGMAPIRMAVNLSLCQLLRGDVVAIVEAALRKNNLQPELLEIELSERGVLNRRPEVLQEILRLKAIGVRISIDDFGTGNASISYLKDLPVDVIKIDRSYLSGTERTARDEALASGMVTLARRLQATVIAEGVETVAQLETLRAWGSEECQGFLFSAALPADEFVARFG